MSCRALDFITYREYLESPHWEFVRDAALWAASYRCQLCRGQRDLQVHHNNYDCLGDETPDDLVVLCKKCHEIYSLHAKGML